MAAQQSNPFLAPRRIKVIEELRRHAAEYFRKKGLAVSERYDFILDRWDNWERNIVDPAVASYIKGLKDQCHSEGKPFPLHKYIHHGLSSQAMLFNLLGPLIVRSDWETFDRILLAANTRLAGHVCAVELEVEDRDVFKEKSAQPTSVDMVIQTDADERLYAEFKFTEAEFGGCSLFFNGDCDGRNPSSNHALCLLHDAGRTYWTKMVKYGLVTPQVVSETRCPFIDLYQAYRVLMFALDKGGEFLLIHDDRNPAIHVQTPSGMHRGVYARFLEYLPPEAKAKCHYISTQGIFRIISERIKDDWVNEVGKKYALAEQSLVEV